MNQREWRKSLLASYGASASLGVNDLVKLKIRQLQIKHWIERGILLREQLRCTTQAQSSNPIAVFGNDACL